MLFILLRATLFIEQHYKTKLIERTPNNSNILDAEVFVSLKYLGNYWRSPDFPLINFEIKLDLSWSNKCIISEVSMTPTIGGNPATPARNTIGTIFQINNPKLYVAVVTFSINDNIRFLENIRQGFKRTILWNKHRSKITTQIKK